MMGDDRQPSQGVLPEFLQAQLGGRWPGGLKWLPPMSFGRALPRA